MSHRHPILFLDFDGVLNNDETATRVAFRSDPVTAGKYAGLDPLLVARLNEVFKRVASPVTVAICSSWRQKADLGELTELLREAGYEGPDPVDATPILPRKMSEYSSYRAREILAWLAAQPVSWWPVCVLDDCMDGMQALKDWHVAPDQSRGLTDEDVDVVVRMLNRGLS